MDAKGYADAIEALLKQMSEDGYRLDIENACYGCCSDFEATILKAERVEGRWQYTEIVDVNLDT